MTAINAKNNTVTGAFILTKILKLAIASDFIYDSTSDC